MLAERVNGGKAVEADADLVEDGRPRDVFGAFEAANGGVFYFVFSGASKTLIVRKPSYAGAEAKEEDGKNGGKRNARDNKNRKNPNDRKQKAGACYHVLKERFERKWQLDVD